MKLIGHEGLGVKVVLIGVTGIFVGTRAYQELANFGVVVRCGILIAYVRSINVQNTRISKICNNMKLTWSTLRPFESVSFAEARFLKKRLRTPARLPSSQKSKTKASSGTRAKGLRVNFHPWFEELEEMLQP